MKTKSRKIICVFLCLALLLASVFTLAACGGHKQPPAPDAKFTVTVENGTGGGKFKTGRECTVTADVPDDKAFAKWMVNGEEVSRENPYTFTVDKDVKITAVIGVPYTVTVDGGKIGDTTDIEAEVVAGETVTVKAKSTAAKTFLYWLSGEEETKIYENPYTFTVKGDTNVKAVYDEVCLISVADGQVYPEGKPEEGARSMRVDMGGKCTIKANEAPQGQKFAYWYCVDKNDSEVVVSENAEYTLTVTASRKIYAMYKYYFALTVVGGHIGDTELSQSDVWKDENVTVNADVPANMGFVCWKIGEEKVSTSPTYTFKMTERTVITAEYSDYVQIAAPKNDANQMFKYLGYGDTRNTTEFDRQKNEDESRKTAFVDGVDHLLYYIYTSSDSEKDAYVGQFKLVKNANNAANIITTDGSASIGCGSEPGNYYVDNTSKSTFYAFFKAAIGDDYNPSQNYYFAVQSVAIEGSVYLDSEISEIGTSSIREA